MSRQLVSSPLITRLRPHQLEIIGTLHGAARKDFVFSTARLTALPLVLAVLIAALAVELKLMLHSMQTLLDDGTGSQPVTLLAMASFLAIMALRVLTRQPGSEAIHRWMMRIGLVALVVFLAGFGGLVSMSSWEVASAMVLHPGTGIDGIDAWLDDGDTDPEPESFALALRDLVSEYGGLVALILATLGLGCVFFLSVLVSHFLIGLALKLSGDFVTARTRMRESARLKAAMMNSDAELGAAAQHLAEAEATSPTAAVQMALATLTAKADQALSYPRRLVLSGELTRNDETGGPVAGLGSEFLGLPGDVGTVDLPALKARLAEIESAVNETALFATAANVAVTEFGLTKADLTDANMEMIND